MKEALTPEMIVFAAILSAYIIAGAVITIANYLIRVDILNAKRDIDEGLRLMDETIEAESERMQKEEDAIKKMIGMFDNDLIITS